MHSCSTYKTYHSAMEMVQAHAQVWVYTVWVHACSFCCFHAHFYITTTLLLFFCCLHHRLHHYLVSFLLLQLLLVYIIVIIIFFFYIICFFSSSLAPRCFSSSQLSFEMRVEVRSASIAHNVWQVDHNKATLSAARSCSQRHTEQLLPPVTRKEWESISW